MQLKQKANRIFYFIFTIVIWYEHGQNSIYSPVDYIDVAVHILCLYVIINWSP